MEDMSSVWDQETISTLHGIPGPAAIRAQNSPDHRPLTTFPQWENTK